MTPSTIVVAFTSVVFFSFNPEAIHCGISEAKVDESDKMKIMIKISSLGIQLGSKTQHSSVTNEKEVCKL